MTGISETERARLREVAEAATPGPWEVYQTIHAEAWVCEVGRGGFGAVSLPATGRPDYGLANAEHVATFDPPTVLALLDALVAVEAERDDYRAKWEQLRTHVLRNPQMQALHEAAKVPHRMKQALGERWGFWLGDGDLVDLIETGRLGPHYPPNTAHPMYRYDADTHDDHEYTERLELTEQLQQAIYDVCWKATPCGQDAEGFTTHYLISVGPIHRLVAAAQGVVPNVALWNPNYNENGSPATQPEGA